jgi:hypothetical protein
VEAEVKRRTLKAGRFAALAGDFWRNPKRHMLGHSAQALYCAALSYAADQTTDGEVPDYILPALAGSNASGIADGIAKELVARGWWTRLPNGYGIVGYSEYNPTRAELEDNSRKQSTKAKRRWSSDGNAGGIAPPDPRPHIDPPNPPEGGEGGRPAYDAALGVPPPKPASDPEPIGPSDVRKVLKVFEAAWKRRTGRDLGLTPNKETQEAIELWRKASERQPDDPLGFIASAADAYAGVKARGGKLPFAPWRAFCGNPWSDMTPATEAAPQDGDTQTW